VNGPAAVDLELVHLRSATGGADPGAGEVLAAARAHQVLGAVVEQMPASTSAAPPVVLALPVDGAGRLLQLVRGRVTTGPLATLTVDRVARELDSVAVRVAVPGAEADDEVGADAGPGPLGDVRVASDVVVTAFGGRRAVDRELALEVALLTQSEVVLARRAPWTLAVHGPSRDGLDLQPWPESMRPAVTLTHRPGEVLWVEAHLPHDRGQRGHDGVRGRDLRRRWNRRVLEHALPSWSWAVLPERTEPLVDEAAHPELDDDARRLVRQLQGQPEPTRLGEALGLEGAERDRLVSVLREPLSPQTPRAVVAALGLPDVAAQLSTGELGAQALPGAVGAAPHGFVGTVRESLLSRPEGSGWWARLRRLDHDRPWLSVLFIAGEVALGAAMAARALGAFGAPLPTVWAVGLGAGAVLCALDAAGNAVLLGAVQRRRARERAAADR